MFSEAAPKSKSGYLKISCNVHVCTPYPSFPNQRPEITEQTDFRRKLGRGRRWQAVISAPRNPTSGTHSNPFRTGAEVPKSQQRVAQPETSCWRLELPGPEAWVLPRRVHPRGPQSRARTSPQATESAGERVGANRLEGFPGFKLSLSELPGALAFISGVGAEGQKMSPRTSLPRSSLGLGGSPWEEPTQPQALLGRRESTPRRGQSGCPGRVGVSG